MKVGCLVLNWNELSVSKDSVRRLLKEPEVDSVFVVDNGSTDGSKEYFGKMKGVAKFGFIDLPTNTGPSVARNIGISMIQADAIFLIDGDILYCPGTIKEYAKILEKYPDAFCVGQNSFERVMQLGYNGTMDPIEADMRMPDDYTISDWFPMSWTQYGLFRADLLKAHPFIEEGAFGEAGYGLEDTWLYHQMKGLGYVSLAVDKPLYYHQAHSGIKELVKAGLSLKLEERKKIFEKKWGKGMDWSEILVREKPEHTTRPKP